jgi:aldehyde:ferredoxin oxidoreductase
MFVFCKAKIQNVKDISQEEIKEKTQKSKKTCFACLMCKNMIFLPPIIDNGGQI